MNGNDYIKFLGVAKEFALSHEEFTSTMLYEYINKNNIAFRRLYGVKAIGLNLSGSGLFNYEKRGNKGYFKLKD